MSSLYSIEKHIESIQMQVEILCKMLGIDPIPLPTDENYNIEQIQAQLDPDA